MIRRLGFAMSDDSLAPPPRPADAVGVVAAAVMRPLGFAGPNPYSRGQG